MLRIILCSLLFLQVAHGWGWFKPCKMMEKANCDGYAVADNYYYRDGDRHGHGHWGDNDRNRHHGHDNDYDRHHNHDNDNHRHHGHDNDYDRHHNHDNDYNRHHSHDNDYNRHHNHDNDYNRHNHYDDESDDTQTQYRDGVWGSGWHHENWNGNKKMCGSDGVTYKNRCSFVKAHCQHKSIELRHEGACTAADTTVAPVKTTAVPSVVDAFCKNILTQTCHGVSPICATNGQSYDNECEFEKAKCFDNSIHVKHLGTC